MNLLGDAYRYYLQNQDFFWQAAQRHVLLSLSALTIALAVCLPLGIWAARRVMLGQVVINLFSTLRVLPSLAVLFLALPYLGVGFVPALAALTLLACPPVLINTYAGLRGIDPSMLESAHAMGMTPTQALLRVELPLALPAILAGVRIAAVEVISSATLAAFIGAGGLGDFITRGYALYEPRIMLVGAVPIAALALGAETIFGGLASLRRWNEYEAERF